MTLTAQLGKPYVGALVDLFEIDLTPIGSTNRYFYTPSSSSPIVFNGNTYYPLPISIESQDKTMNGAPGRVTLTVSNINGLLAPDIINFGDMLGARVVYTRTFDELIASNESFPPVEMVVFQKNVFTRDTIQWILTTPLDRPYTKLPLRKAMKKDLGIGIAYCPGLMRFRL